MRGATTLNRRRATASKDNLGDAAQRMLVTPIIQYLICRAFEFDVARHSLALRDAFEKHIIGKEPVPSPSKVAGLIDIGCGEGWLDHALSGWSRSKVKYVGFDKEQRWGNARKDNYAVKDLTQDSGFPEVQMASLAGLEGSVLTAIAVLDQLSEAQLHVGLKNIGSILNRPQEVGPKRQQADARKTPILLVATLDPEYFVSPIGYEDAQRYVVDRGSGVTARWSEELRAQKVSEHAKFTEPYLRSTEWYEAAFTHADIIVLDCMPIPWVRLTEAEIHELTNLPGLKDERNATRPCGSGPFIFWLLAARRPGAQVGPQFIDKLKNPILDAIKAQGRVPELELLDFQPGEIVIHPGTRGGELMIVAEGQLELNLPNDTPSFGIGEMIGELESGTNLVSSRYLFPVTATRDGPGGCKVIRIPRDLTTSLLAAAPTVATGKEEASATPSVAQYAYETLRDRFAKHNLLAGRSNDRGNLVPKLKAMLSAKHSLDDKVRNYLDGPRYETSEEAERKLREKIIDNVWSDDPFIDAIEVTRPYVVGLGTAKRSQTAGKLNRCVESWSPYSHAANAARAILFALAEEHDRLTKAKIERHGDNFVRRNTGYLQSLGFLAGADKANVQKQFNLPPLRTLFKLGFIDFWDNNDAAQRDRRMDHPNCKSLLLTYSTDISSVKNVLFGSDRDYIIFVRDLRGLLLLISTPDRRSEPKGQLSTPRTLSVLYWAALWRELKREVKGEHRHAESGPLFSAFLQKVIANIRRGGLGGSGSNR